MRAHRDAELCRHEDDRKALVHAAEPAAVNLTEVNRLGLEQLLEDDPVLRVFDGRDADGADASRNRGMPQHIVWTARLLDPEQVEIGERAHALHRLADIPALVGIYHQFAGWADLL